MAEPVAGNVIEANLNHQFGSQRFPRSAALGTPTTRSTGRLAGESRLSPQPFQPSRERCPVILAKRILPLHLRPALLAGVAIVERAGPEMLRVLRGHMMGDNWVRFTDATENMIARGRKWKASSPMHLI